MSAAPGRILCAHCGANNFETQAACWKCGNLLKSGPPSAVSASAASAAPIAPVAGSVEPSVAIIWGALLGIIFPAIAVPVGMVFMMLDDRRKLEIGRLTLIVGLVSSIVHLLLTLLFFQLTFSKYLQMAMGVVQAVKQSQQPGLNDEVGNGGLRGIPRVSPGFGGAGGGRAGGGSTIAPLTDDGEVVFPEPPRGR